MGWDLSYRLGRPRSPPGALFYIIIYAHARVERGWVRSIYFFSGEAPLVLSLVGATGERVGGHQVRGVVGRLLLYIIMMTTINHAQSEKKSKKNNFFFAKPIEKCVIV